MSINLRISGVASETGALLQDYLRERGVVITHRGEDGTVCYGSPSSTPSPTLNANCRTSKIDRMVIMNQYGVRTVPWFSGSQPPPNFTFPALARRATGHGGTDIIPVFQPEEVPWRVDAGWDWFSSFIPVAAEYRVWIFRGTHLDTYEKVMVRPGDYVHVGRNFRNGFDFLHRPDGSGQGVLTQAIEAVRVLGLDFAAVDLLEGKDGLAYVLECNTAPGVIRSGAQRTLGKLADCIVEWERGGYRERWESR